MDDEKNGDAHAAAGAGEWMGATEMAHWDLGGGARPAHVAQPRPMDVVGYATNGV